MIRAIITSLSRGIILWLVDQKPMSGYGIVKELERSTGQHFTSGVIYPLLYELEKEGCISGQWTQKGRRHTKYYSITPTGVELLKQLRELFEMPMREALIEFIAKEDTTN
jgi:PadR family transcriptional regulator PadR